MNSEPCVDQIDGDLGARPELIEEWDALVDRSLRPRPWLRPGWVLAWWRAFGRGELRLVGVRSGGRLVALLPVRPARGVVAPANYHSPDLDIVAEDGGAADELLAAALGPAPHRVQLRFLPRHSPTTDIVHARLAASGYRLLERTIARSPYIDLTGTWDGYVAGLDGKLRRELRRRRRRLDARGRVDVEVHDGRRELDRLLDDCFRVEALGRKGHQGTAMVSSPATRAFYRDVSRWAAARGMLRLARLVVDGQPVAVDLALEDHDRHYLLKTGYDPDLGNLAPGLLLRAAMVERAFEAGLQSYELLGRDEPWKLAWTATTRELVDLRAFRPGVAGFTGWAVTSYVRPVAVRVLERAGR